MRNLGLKIPTIAPGRLKPAKAQILSFTHFAFCRFVNTKYSRAFAFPPSREHSFGRSNFRQKPFVIFLAEILLIRTTKMGFR
jgi:hypothetical protein